jgi:hypothetical protein
LGGGSLNSIVIAPMPTLGMGPWLSVTLSRSSDSIRPWALWRWAVFAAVGAGWLFRRASTPFRLASESIRNCDETTTRWPAFRPRLISVWPPVSRPVSTSTGAKRPPSSATITTARRPVWITASVGTSKAFPARLSMNCIVTNRPGTNCPLGLANCTRAFSVRVVVFTSGSSACTLPRNTAPGTPGLRASTWLPGRTSAAWLSGSSALAQTLAKPLMRASIIPGLTVMPSRATSSATTPLDGA